MRDINGDKTQDFYNEADFVNVTKQLSDGMFPRKSKKSISPYKALLWILIIAVIAMVVSYLVAHTNVFRDIKDILK